MSEKNTEDKSKRTQKYVFPLHCGYGPVIDRLIGIVIFGQLKQPVWLTKWSTQLPKKKGKTFQRFRSKTPMTKGRRQNSLSVTTNKPQRMTNVDD